MECERGTHSHACLLSLSHFPANSSPVVVFTAAMAAHTFYLGAKCGGGAEAATQWRGGNLAGGGGATPSQASVAGVSKDAPTAALVWAPEWWAPRGGGAGARRRQRSGTASGGSGPAMARAGIGVAALQRRAAGLGRRGAAWLTGGPGRDGGPGHQRLGGA
jgi:hypothetical protein